MQKVVSSVVQPVADPLRQWAHDQSDWWQSFTHSGRLTAENRRLKAVEQTYELYGATTNLLVDEVDELRNLVKLPPRVGKERIAADVWLLAANESRMSLSVGSNQGVKVGMPVESATGLIGTVQTVAKDRCQVILITSPVVRIGATVENVPAQQGGLVRGESPRRLSLELFDTAVPVKVGDWIVTSGFSERIPAGIPIGQITSVDKQEEYGSVRLDIVPSFMNSPLRTVYVLK